jgi:hypothetical protein
LSNPEFGNKGAIEMLAHEQLEIPYLGEFDKEMRDEEGTLS